MQDKLRSWRTTGWGIGAIVVAVGTLAVGFFRMETLDINAIIALVSVAIGEIMAGIGLINGKDANVSHSPEKKALPE